MYREIVTKAIIGKGKKTFRNTYELDTIEDVDTVLGCWVINHVMKGDICNGSVKIEGEFDVNIWYSYDNNTKTNVESKRVNYTEVVNVSLDSNVSLDNEKEILLSSIKSPTVVDVNSNINKISYEIEKTIGIEVIGDAKVKVEVLDDYKEFDDESLVISESDVNDIDVNENYL